MTKEEKQELKDKLIKFGDKGTLANDECLKVLNEKERAIICYRYVNKLEWGEIAEKVYFSKMHCNRIHDKALEKILKFFKLY